MEVTMTESAQDVRKFKIPACNIDLLDKKLKTLQKRATKLGVEKPTYTTLREFDKKIERGVAQDEQTKEWYFKTVTIRFVEIEVHGPVVQANGWDFVASVEHTEAGNAVKSTPGGREVEIPIRFREGGPLCEHCNTSRRRKDSFICHNDETDEFKQVGRNCLADFLGRDPANLVWGLSCWDTIGSFGEVDEEFFFSGGGRSEWSFDFVNFMTAVCHFVRKDGWVSRGQARFDEDAVATAGSAWWLVTPSFDSRESREKQREWDQVRDEDRVEAANALRWTRKTLGDKESTSRTDYEQNLFVALSKPGVVAKDSGIVASLVVGWNRHLERELQRKEREKELAEKSNEYLWEVGERVKDIPLRLVRRQSFQSDYGASVLHVFEDENGNCVNWWGGDYFTDKETGTEAKFGDTCQASWTVKKHEDYKGRKQTTVFRPARQKVIPQETKNEES